MSKRLEQVGVRIVTFAGVMRDAGNRAGARKQPPRLQSPRASAHRGKPMGAGTRHRPVGTGGRLGAVQDRFGRCRVRSPSVPRSAIFVIALHGAP